MLGCSQNLLKFIVGLQINTGRECVISTDGLHMQSKDESAIARDPV